MLFLLLACQPYSENDGNASAELLHLDPIFPVPDEVYTDDLGAFKLRVHDGVTDDLVLVINGKNFIVNEHDDIEVFGNRIYVSMQDIRGALVLGENSVGVRSDELGFFEAYSFFYDNQNPRLKITGVFAKPSRGCYLNADGEENEVNLEEAAEESVYYCEDDKLIAPKEGDVAIVEGEFIDPSPIASFTVDHSGQNISFFYEDENGHVERLKSLERANRFEITLPQYASKKSISYSLRDILGQQTDQTLVYPGKPLGTVASVQLNVDFTDNARPLIDELFKGILALAEELDLVNQDDVVTVPKFNSKKLHKLIPVESAVANTDDSARVDDNWLLATKGTFNCPEFLDLKAVPTNGKKPLGCGFLYSSQPILKSPTVDFGFWKHDDKNAMQAYLDINLKQVAFDVELYTYTDRSTKVVSGNNVPVLLYAGGYKTRVTLDNVTLRATVALKKSSEKFIHVGDISNFTLRYTNDIEQKLADWLTESTVVPKLSHTRCDICKNGEAEIADFVVKWGILSRREEVQSGLAEVEAGISEIFKPILEQVIRTIPTINDPIKFANLGLKRRYYDKKGKPLHVDADCGHPVDANGQAYNADFQALERYVDVGDPVDPVDDIKTCKLVLVGAGNDKNEQFAVEVEPAPTELHLQQTLQVNSIITKKDFLDEHLRYAAKIDLSGSFAAKGEDAKKVGIGSHYQDASKDKRIRSISYDGSIDATLALSSSAINQYIFTQHQLGFLASDGIDFTMTTDLLNVLEGQALGLNDFYSYMFEKSDLVDDSAADKSTSVANFDEIEVKLITHQSPYVELTGETPGRKGILANFFGVQFPNLGGKDLVPGSVKIIVPDVQVVVYNKGREGTTEAEKLLDFRMSVDLDTYISASDKTYLPQLTPKDVFSKVKVLSVDHFPYPDVSDIAKRTLLSYAMVRTIDHSLERKIDGDIDQLNVLLMGLMRKMSRLENVEDAGCIDNTSSNTCGKLDLPSLPIPPVTYKSLLSGMKFRAILHKPVFRWLTVDKDSGWLTMGIDLQTSRPNVCPQFKAGLGGDVYGDGDGERSGTLSKPILTDADPLSICIHSADVP